MNKIEGGMVFAGLIMMALLFLAVAARSRATPPPVPFRRPAAGGRQSTTNIRRRRPLSLNPCYVYFINDTRGKLWYIGEAEDVVERLHGHEDYQAGLPDGHRRKWWHLIDPVVAATYVPNQVIEYPNEATALAAERAWIRQLNPPGNVIKYKTEAA